MVNSPNPVLFRICQFECKFILAFKKYLLKHLSGNRCHVLR